MTTPTPPTDEDASRAANYYMESLATFQRWFTRGKWMGYTAAAVAFGLTLIVMSKVTPDKGGLGFFTALAAAVVVLMISLSIVLPRLPMPVLRCPFCAGRVPLIAPPKPFRPFDLVKVCPSCQRSLPVL